MKGRALLLAGVTAACVIPSAIGGGGSPGVLLGGKGVAAPGGAVRYVTFTKGKGTVVAKVLTNGGQVARFRWLRGGFGIPLVANDGSAEGLTRDGRTLVLAPAGVAPNAVVSRFALVDTSTLRVRRFVMLPGAFAYDALAPDGKTLYLIELLQNGGTYRVRAYDLAARKLLPGAIVDPQEADEPMIGTPVSRVSSATGRWVYTLYMRPEKPPFIHALDASNRKARCIDLPAMGSQDTIFQMRMKLNRNGTKLVVRNSAGGTEAVVNTRTFKATRA